MSKRVLNQNSKYVQELIDMIEPDFIFNDKPINRLKIVKEDENTYQKKINELSELKKEISSIENCNIKNNSKNLIMGDGNINSPIMLIGETPGEIEDKIGMPFQGEKGALLKKMLSAINIDINKIYSTYSINLDLT